MQVSHVDTAVDDYVRLMNVLASSYNILNCDFGVRQSLNVNSILETLPFVFSNSRSAPADVMRMLKSAFEFDAVVDIDTSEFKRLEFISYSGDTLMFNTLKYLEIVKNADKSRFIGLTIALGNIFRISEAVGKPIQLYAHKCDTYPTGKITPDRWTFESSIAETVKSYKYTVTAAQEMSEICAKEIIRKYQSVPANYASTVHLIYSKTSEFLPR